MSRRSTGTGPSARKITRGELRQSGGPARPIVYCVDYKCAHSVVINADRWGDEVRIRLSGLRPSWRRYRPAL